MMPNMHGASVVVPDDAVEGETPATATAVDDGVVIQGYVIGAEPVASSSLADMADLFRRQLNLSGNVVEVVDAACAQLGVPGRGPLVDRAARCRAVLDGTAAAATASAVAVEGKAFDGDDLAALVRELPSKAWSGGKDAGSWSGEAYAKNPWRFDGDGTFTTERDGCHGAWTVRRDLDRLVLRMDWRGGQEGHYAEFARRGDAFENVAASYGFMRSWSIVERGAVAPRDASHLNRDLNDVARNTDDVARARSLVAAGADLSSTNGRPWHHTPLHQAAFHGRYDMAAALVELGAPLFATSNPCGRGGAGTPLDLARGGGHAKLAELLERAAAAPAPVVHERVGGLTYAASEKHARARGGRLPTLAEARRRMGGKALCPGDDQWCAVAGRDWVQIGDRHHHPGKSHVADCHQYPPWGDDANNTTYGRPTWNAYALYATSGGGGDLDGAWFSFATGGDAANVVDRFEAREAGGRVTFYRGGAPMESYAVEGTQLVGAVRASVAPGGDILWSHGYTSRREGAPAAQRIARRPATRETIFDPAHYANGGPRGDQDVGGVVCACAPCMVLCPLQALATCGCASAVDALTALPCKFVPCAPCDPNAMNPLWFNSQAHGWAASHGQLHTVMALAKNGANLEQFNLAGNNARTDAERERHYHITAWYDDWVALGMPKGAALPF